MHDGTANVAMNEKGVHASGTKTAVIKSFRLEIQKVAQK